MPPFRHRHLIGITGLSPEDIIFLLDEAEQWVDFNRRTRKLDDRLTGLTQVNAFFENSTRTLLSFEVAGKRLYRRLTFVAESSRIVKAFYPVFPPDRDAATVLGWLRAGVR